MNENKKLPVVLVIGPFNEDWYQLCQDCKDKFQIEQANFEDIGISSYSDYPIVCISPPREIKYEFQKKNRVIKPSLIVVRSCVRYVGRKCGETPDFRNVLYGFIHGNIPMINSFESLLFELERPIIFGILKGIQEKIGEKNFPLIPQTYYSDSSEMITSPDVPFVIKYSYPHAGYGKIRIRDNHDFPDIRSIVAIDNHYCAAEPLIDSEYELRIVFIAPDYYRAHKRSSFNWKVNFGSPNIRENVEMNQTYKMWVDEVRKAIPGMDCFAIDAIVDKEGNHFILEVNGSSQGFVPEQQEECLEQLKKLVISKVDDIVNKKKDTVDNKPCFDDDLTIKNLNLSNEIRDLMIQNKDQKLMIDSLKKKLVMCSSQKSLFKFRFEWLLLFIFASIIAIAFIYFGRTNPK
ncbi:Asparaginyl-tRNA synthetase, cytoplasmic (Asparagine--tRNA ligase) (AsnRS) [Tritrichomonas musculus]|uniref:Asparaginyl-tRNA synthetase, cytoplasmic (Asparagine--tRNA ligase) (AsnRS) n=1 Tax=Tritrichomonas musculus TaxID=1915356 RepID=A0ABR2H868_9EUKA